MRQAACFFVLFGVAITNRHLGAQQPILKTTAAGVVIDVTVLDRDGHPVLDIGLDDFEITEDGARQQVISATLVQAGVVRSRNQKSGDETAASQAPVGASPLGAAQAPTLGIDDTPSITAILFDRLSPEMRPFARLAAQAFVSTLSSPREYAGVFLSDLALTTFQPFTNQPASLRQAVDRMAMTAPTSLTPDAERARSPRRTDGLDPNQAPTAGAESNAGFVSAGDRERRLNEMEPVERMMALLELRMEEGYGQFLTEYQGQASIAGLRAVVNSLAALPGRKSILYFTESLPIASSLKPKFDLLIGQANRANVTVYPVDAAGLRVHSKEAEVSRNVEVAGAQGVGDSRRGDGPWTKELEKQEQILTSRPSAALGRLAKETGGFLLDNTNNLAAGVARIQQERTTYYLVAYQATNARLDGSFRRVNVKVKRPRVTVRARAGYVAVPPQSP
jgi:VWFA-related protein